MHRRSLLLASLGSPMLLWSSPSRAAQVAYPQVVPGERLRLPRDHGAHPDFRTEWWYVTGALSSEGQRFGFQLTFFRSRSGYGETLASPLSPRQIVFAHAAISQPGKPSLHAERVARPGLGAGYATEDCALYVGPWTLQRVAGDAEHFVLAVRDTAFSLSLRLSPSQAPLWQGDGGYSRKGPAPEQASYYLSWPQLHVAGELQLGGRRLPVGGRAWFDHEWSSELLAPGAVGWDWLGLNLTDGGALMVFRIRDQGGGTMFAHATWRARDGRRRDFTNADIAFVPRRHWRSPTSGATYPVEMEIRVGPYSLVTRPLSDAQEIAARRPRPLRYWEGLVDTEGDLTGQGYLELTGYADALRM